MSGGGERSSVYMYICYNTYFWAEIKKTEVSIGSPGNNLVSHGDEGVSHVTCILEDLFLVGLEVRA